MRRSTMKIGIAFGMLALIASAGIASDSAAAQVSAAECENAWAASEAYGECGDRVWIPGSGLGPPESISSAGDRCRIATSCKYYPYKNMLDRRNTAWEGGLEDVSRLENCDGYLQLSC